jgi:hypothetical protein
MLHQCSWLHPCHLVPQPFLARFPNDFTLTPFVGRSSRLPCLMSDCSAFGLMTFGFILIVLSIAGGLLVGILLGTLGDHLDRET